MNDNKNQLPPLEIGEAEITHSQIEGDRQKINVAMKVKFNPEFLKNLKSGTLYPLPKFQNYEYTITYFEELAPSSKPQERPDFHTTFMEVAKVIAKRGTCPRLQVGAVITQDNKIISTGYNGAPSGSKHCSEIGCLIEKETGRCKRTVHAEVNALIQANFLEGATMYTTEFPCIECAGIIANSGVDTLYFRGHTHYKNERAEQAWTILEESEIEIVRFVE